jgi:hypothetical protein
MIIKTVKELANQYAVNVNTTVPKDPENTEFKEIQKWILDGGIVEEQDFLSEKKLSKKEAINAQRDSNMAKNTLHRVNGKDHYFQRNVSSNLAWLNTIDSSTDIAVTNWITADNCIVDLTKADLISICSHIRDRDTMEVIQARKRKDAIKALTTVKAVESYDITTIYEI